MTNISTKSCASLWIYLEVMHLFAISHSHCHTLFSHWHKHRNTPSHTHTHTHLISMPNFGLLGRTLLQLKNGEFLWTDRVICGAGGRSWKARAFLQRRRKNCQPALCIEEKMTQIMHMITRKVQRNSHRHLFFLHLIRPGNTLGCNHSISGCLPNDTHTHTHIFPQSHPKSPLNIMDNLVIPVAVWILHEHAESVCHWLSGESLGVTSNIAAVVLPGLLLSSLF